jgi:hypothetical protein
MARTVGLPAGIAVKLILADEIPLTGCQIPIHPAIYEPILAELAAAGLRFEETVTPLDDDAVPRSKTLSVPIATSDLVP